MKKIFLVLAFAFLGSVFAVEPLKVGISDMCPKPGEGEEEAFYHLAFASVGFKTSKISYSVDTNALREIVRKLDLVVFTGGEDVDPARYHAKPMPWLWGTNLRRDAFDFALFAACRAENKPVFGICRGMQAMNVAFGGTLYQDIGKEYKAPEGVAHDQHGGMDFFKGATNPPSHEIIPVAGSRFAEAIGKDPLKVNSFHHQGVKDLAPGFRVSARSKDGFVEAIESDDYPAAGVQFHPEHTVYYHPNTGFDLGRITNILRSVLKIVQK